MNLALNPFSNGKNPENIDKVEVSKELEKQIEEIYHVYKIYQTIIDHSALNARDTYEALKHLDALVALPDIAIYMLSQKMGRGGVLLSRLIQISYDNGYNNFMVHGIDRLGYYLQGKYRDRIKVHINGNAEGIGEASHYCDFYVHGSAGYGTGMDALKSRFYIDGDCWVGSHPRSCRFEVDGSIRFHNSFGLYPKDCTFKLRRTQKVPRSLFDQNRVIRK
ncbi:hypothetical protein KY330_05785 [Candidatus Woesearchaeota archaeon]|nr:hypothetical protein [Candidatus Woesearchaeota archaeon]